MRVMVLGAGVIGVTTAYYLAKAGFEVEVYDRAKNAAEETSHGNAGQLSYGYSSPWAAPGIPLKAIKWLLQKHSPLAIRPTLDPQQYLWMLQLLRNCTASRYSVNKARMLRIADYSRECIDQLRADTGIDYEGRQQGLIQLLRTRKQLKAEINDTKVLDALNIPYKVLDKQGVLNYEPALANSSASIKGGLYFPQDQTGDCNLFTKKLAAMAEELGVKFYYQQQVDEITCQGPRVCSVMINGVEKQADNYVLALGSYSPKIVHSLGIKLPVYPFKGYSITANIRDESRAPVSTILDESYKIAITRFDQRIRVGGMAEVVGYNLSLNPKRQQTLAMVASELYPDAADYYNTELWTGLRPATPDGTPIIGATQYPNLFINTGHGTLGWTMACGSGKLLADIMADKPTGIDTDGLGLERYSKQR